MSKNSGHEKAPVLAGAEALDNVNRSRKNVMSDNSTNVILSILASSRFVRC